MKINCVKCGESKSFSSDRLEKNLKLHGGSEDKLRKAYVCRGCRPSKAKAAAKPQKTTKVATPAATQDSQSEQSSF
jgi:hypothetical protein